MPARWISARRAASSKACCSRYCLSLRPACGPDAKPSVVMIEIVKPALEHLPSYKAALERGWSPDNVRLEEATREQLVAIEEDPVAFLASLDDPEAKGPPIAL